MPSLQEIKARIERTLIETDGNPTPEQMALIIQDAREAGLGNNEIARLVPEVDRGINWAAIRAEKATREAEAAAKEQEAIQEEESQQQAKEQLEALLHFAMDDGIATVGELKNIFEAARRLEYDSESLALLIQARFREDGFRPYPAPDLSKASLREALISTNWHNARRFAEVSAAPPPHPATKPIAGEPPTIRPVQLPYQPMRPAPQPAAKPFVAPKKKSNSTVWILLVLLIPLFFLVKNSGVVDDFVTPRQPEGLKGRTIAESVALRSSPNTKSQANIIGDLQFGTPFTALDTLNAWIRVRTLTDEGYVAASLTLPEDDYQLLASIFVDEESREAIADTRYRKALLNYFKENNYSGPVVAGDQSGGNASSDRPAELWQVRASDARPSTVYFGRVTHPGSAYSDFGVLITQRATGRRRFLLFSFDRSGNALLEDDQAAPDSGNIASVTKVKGRYVVKYD